ncbi:MAG TPA: nucleotidyltransferase domain-containing protein [Anaerolineae bacterium]
MNDTERLQLLSERDKLALADFVARLQQQFDNDAIQSVWVFGSKVRGTDDGESDIDLLIVVRNYSWQLEKAITELAVAVDLAHDVVLSDHIVDSRHFAQMLAQGVPLYRSAMEEGVDLWQMELRSIT